MSLFIGYHVGGCCRGARRTDAVKRLKEWTVETLQRCRVSPVEPGCRSWLILLRQRWSSGLATVVELASVRPRLAAGPSAAYCTAGLDLLFPVCLLCQTFIQPPQTFISAPKKKTNLGSVGFFFFWQDAAVLFLYAPSKKKEDMIQFKVQQ